MTGETTESGPRFDPATICAEVARQALGRYVHALPFLEEQLRGRVESLAALVRGLLDLALEPGFGGERLAKILLWQDRLEMALDEGGAEEPIFARFAELDAARPWNRVALARLMSLVRAVALSSEPPPPEALAEVLSTLALDRPVGDPVLVAIGELLAGRPASGEPWKLRGLDLSRSERRALAYACHASRGGASSWLGRLLLDLRARLA